jgi:putative membrane protein
MRDEVVLKDAGFESAVKYYVLSAAVPLTLLIVTIPLLLIILPLIYIVRTIEYRHIQCTLLERSLRVRRGVLNKVEKTIPLDKITDLGINQGPIMRFCGVESISIETAGQSSAMGASLVHLVGVKEAKKFRDAVLSQRDALADGLKPGKEVVVEPVSSSTESTDLIREIRDTLGRIEQKLGNE